MGDIQEIADAVLAIEGLLESSGVREMGSNLRRFQLAEAFAQRIRLVSSHSQARALIAAHPKEASAFLHWIIWWREKLEERGAEISCAPRTPLEIYSVAADAVCEAVRISRRLR